MRSITFIICFFLSLTLAFCQSNNNIEALKEQLRSVKKDSLKYPILADIAWEMLSWEQYDSVKFYAENAEALAQLFNDPLGISNPQNTLAVYYQRLENYDKALLYLDRSLQNRKAAGSKKGIAMTYNNMGSVYMDMKEYEKALGYFFFSMNLYEELLTKNSDAEEAAKIRRSLGNSYNNMASIFYRTNEYELAVKYYRQSVNLSLRYGEERINAGYTMSNIAKTYIQLNKPDSSIVWFKKSLQESEKVADTNNITETTYNLGISFQKKQEYPNARAWFERSLTFLKPQKDNKDISDCFFQIGVCHAAEKDYKAALLPYQKAFKLYEEMKQEEKRKKCAQKIAEAYEASGNKKKAKKYKQLAL